MSFLNVPEFFFRACIAFPLIGLGLVANLLKRLNWPLMAGIHFNLEIDHSSQLNLEMKMLMFQTGRVTSSTNLVLGSHHSLAPRQHPDPCSSVSVPQRLPNRGPKTKCLMTYSDSGET